MLQSGVLLDDLAAVVEQNDGTAEGALRARLCATIFLIGRLPASGAAHRPARRRHHPGPICSSKTSAAPGCASR